MWDVLLKSQESEWPPSFCVFLASSLHESRHFGRGPYRPFATRVSQLKIWHFWAIGIERNVRRCASNRYSVITRFAKLAAGEQLCRRCTHRKLWHFKSFKSFSWKIADFELWHCCRRWGIRQLSRTFLVPKSRNSTCLKCVMVWLVNKTT